MRFAPSIRHRSALVHIVAATFLAGAGTLEAQRGGGGGDTQGPAWDVTVPRGTTRDIDFTTNEGTWMSVDVTPDGQWVLFDLLGHIYRVPAAGGQAQSLTQSSGIAVNFQPRISPDGKLIAFISDRRGQNNLWVMNIDGSNPHAVLLDLNLRASTPVWTADGQFIVIHRAGTAGGGEGGGGGAGLWMYSKDGGTGIEVVSADRPEEPSLSSGREVPLHYSRLPSHRGSCRARTT